MKLPRRIVLALAAILLLLTFGHSAGIARAWSEATTYPAENYNMVDATDPPEPDEAPKEDPTEQPTVASEQKPTELPEDKTVDEPTEIPTEKPVAQPTDMPMEEQVEQPGTVLTVTPADTPTPIPAVNPVEPTVDAPSGGGEPAPPPTRRLDSVFLYGGMGLGLLLLAGATAFFVRSRRAAAPGPTAGVPTEIAPGARNGLPPSVATEVGPPASDLTVLSAQPPRLMTGDGQAQVSITTLPFTIGRAPDNSLPIAADHPHAATLAARHAQISQMAVRGRLVMVIEALGPDAELRVGGRLTPKNLLQDGDQIAIGGLTFTYRAGGNA